MTLGRSTFLTVAKTAVPLPCFFPSVSSVKTNLLPIDYIELLSASASQPFLISAYDIANCSAAHRLRMDAALLRSMEAGKVILMDSGNYEGFWKNAPEWTPERFHEIARTNMHHLCFCHDNQKPPNSSVAIADDAVGSVLRDQEYALGTVAPIIHGPTNLLPDAARRVAEQLCPILLAVPERALGNGILARVQTVRRIRAALDRLGFYCPLHLLGTGNPLSIAAYALAGADSFDGLEWCQTVVDHTTGKLAHFQQWDLFKDQTDWGRNNVLPYIQAALMHNLEFYGKFMEVLRNALFSESAEALLKGYVTEEQARLLMNSIYGGIE